MLGTGGHLIVVGKRGGGGYARNSFIMLVIIWKTIMNIISGSIVLSKSLMLSGVAMPVTSASEFFDEACHHLHYHHEHYQREHCVH